MIRKVIHVSAGRAVATPYVGRDDEQGFLDFVVFRGFKTLLKHALNCSFFINEIYTSSCPRKHPQNAL